MSLRLLADKVASTEPVPGGGSVACIGASLGAALVAKSLAISLKHADADPARYKTLQELQQRLSIHIRSLHDLADKDAEAFQNCLMARRLPHSSPAQVGDRELSIQSTLLRAIEIPLHAASAIRQCLDLSDSAMKVVEDNVRSDTSCGLLFLHAALGGALLNVQVNLPGLKDAAILTKIRARYAALAD